MEGKTDHPTTVDDYIAQYPKDVQQVLLKLRATIKEAAPGVQESISYHMPAYHLNGRLVYFAVNKRHIGLYPKTAAMIAALPELSAYKGTKSSVHFPLDKPVDFDLIRRIVAVRIAENQESAG